MKFLHLCLRNLSKIFRRLLIQKAQLQMPSKLELESRMIMIKNSMDEVICIWSYVNSFARSKKQELLSKRKAQRMLIKWI